MATKELNLLNRIIKTKASMLEKFEDLDRVIGKDSKSWISGHFTKNPEDLIQPTALLEGILSSSSRSSGKDFEKDLRYEIFLLEKNNYLGSKKTSY